MDTRLAIASKRDARAVDARPLPDGAEGRILEAGRIAGSAHNNQPWEFLVLEDPRIRQQVAMAVFTPWRILESRLVIAITIDHSHTRVGLFDAGRAAQNMMLAAWDEGIGSCPCGLADPSRVDAALGMSGDRRTAVILAFGMPRTRVTPERRTPEEWSGRARRKSLEEIVRRI
jgi:nitroreductase